MTSQKDVNIEISTAQQLNEYDEDYYEMFLEGIQEHFNRTISQYGNSIFVTDTPGLFDTFLRNSPSDKRQKYTCNTCRKFCDTFGGLVSITPDGFTIPVIWPSPEAVPRFYYDSVDVVRQHISGARVTGIFLSSENIWGKPATGYWLHMAVGSHLAFSNSLQTPAQAMAEKRENYKTLLSGLREYPYEAVEQALRVLKTGSLYRSEKVLGMTEWFKGIHEQRAASKNNRIRDNLTWLAVATAPAGFCHIKSSMISTLLDDIKAGHSFSRVSTRFAKKMHPAQYQRPQVAPPAGNIAQAEKTIEKLKAAGSLERRFARLDEVKLIWRPAEQRPKPVEVGAGVFSHLKPKSYTAIRKLDIPTITMTWAKFKRTILPTADTIEFYVPHNRQSYAALVTAVNFDAPPILQWDLPEQRNPVSWYLHVGGSYPGDWGLDGGVYHRMTGICFKPSMWYSEFSQHGEGIVFLLDGAMDKRFSGNALFPEILKAEFHGIRATIEMYSRNAALQGKAATSACGLALHKGASWDAVFRVFSGDSSANYKLDRWD